MKVYLAMRVDQYGDANNPEGVFASLEAATAAFKNNFEVEWGDDFEPLEWSTDGLTASTMEKCSGVEVAWRIFEYDLVEAE